MESDLLYYSGLFGIGLSVYLIANAVFSEEDKFKTSEQLEDDEGGKGNKDADKGAILRYSRPLFKRYVSPMVAGMKGKKAIREKYKPLLANAGLTQTLTPDDFYAFKLFLILGFPVLYIGIREFAELYEWPVAAAPFTGLLGYFYPNIWASGLIAQRQQSIIRSMPFVVDMLALAVEAGLDFVAAMTKVVEKAPKSALSEEFEIMLKEIKIGSSRAESLRNMAWRINLTQVSSFCATLVAADSVGANIGPILKTLAVEMRQKKSAEGEKAGAKAATKILFPMLFLIVPAVMIVIIGPIALQFIYGN